MRLAYNLKAVFSSHAFLNFGRLFVVTACTYSKMSLKFGGSGGGGWGLHSPQPLLAYTLGKPT